MSTCYGCGSPSIDTNIAGLCTKCAGAEIERLQRTVNDLKSGWQSTYDHDTNWLKSEIERLRREHEKAWADAQLKAAEIERLRDKVCFITEQAATYSAEIQRLRLENSQWQSACAGYTEALAARDRDNAALLEELARIRDQIAKHNISIKEAIRRGEAFEWKTLTLDS